MDELDVLSVKCWAFCGVNIYGVIILWQQYSFMKWRKPFKVLSLHSRKWTENHGLTDCVTTIKKLLLWTTSKEVTYIYILHKNAAKF